jgi:C4-dicarboxylate-specific signal transduction histidine kinase
MREKNLNVEDSAILKEVFAVIAHQWRQPLSQINSIVSAIDNRLYEKAIEDEFITEKLLQIEQLTHDMSVNIDDFRGYFSQKRSHMPIKKILQSALDSLKSLFEKQNIQLHIELEDALIFNGDDKLLRQILITLLENAKDALFDRNVYNPKITITGWGDSASLFIKICDNAGGLSKSLQEHLFDPDVTTKHTSQGGGLGLFMVKKLLNEKLEASIDIKNVADGACFTIQLPKE